MTCAEWKALVDEYALGTLEPAERAACDAHLASREPHDGCYDALRSAMERVTAIGLAQEPVLPSPSVWPAIEARLGSVAAAAAPRRRSAEWVAWSVAAALLLCVLWVARDRHDMEVALQVAGDHAAQAQQAHARCADELSQSRAEAKLQQDALDLLTRSGTRLVALAPQGGAASTANMIFHAESQRAFLVAKGLRAPTGKDYELWFIRGDQKIAAGLLRGDDHRGALLTAIDPALLAGAPPDAVAVTLEPAGGGPQPLGPIVLVGKI